MLGRGLQNAYDLKPKPASFVYVCVFAHVCMGVSMCMCE